MSDDFMKAALQARIDGARAPLPDSLPEDRAASFTAQQQTLAELGAEVGGFKVGANGREAEPTAAPLPAWSIFQSGATVAPSCGDNLFVEGELAFIVAQDLPSKDGGYSQAELLQACNLAAAIEIVEPRFADWPNIPPLTALADFSANGATIISEPGPSAADLVEENITLNFSMGEDRKSVPGVDYPGQDAKRLLEWLSNNLSVWGESYSARGLRQGDVIIAGSWIGVIEAAPGALVTVEIPGVGSVSATIAD